ncbi:MAG: hypothetical protein GF308_15425 [Candidatus Heimdallarchaeota archaeon]|nr:hypothetical protein [Candidatus Heimdallarchaeota archaeon]
MEKAKEILSVVEKACAENDKKEVESSIGQLQQLLTEEEQEISDIYSSAVLKSLETFQSRLRSTTVKAMISSLRKIVEQNPTDKELKKDFARALRFSINAISTKGMPSIMEEYMTELEKLANNNPDDVVIHEELALASQEITHYWRKRGDFSNLRSRMKKFRTLAEKFPDNEKIKLSLTKSLIVEIDSANKQDIAVVNELLDEIRGISQSIPMNKHLQLEWVHAYLKAMERTYEDPEDSLRWLKSMKEIVEKNKDENFDLALAKGYLNVIASIGKSNKKALEENLDELEKLAESWKNNREMQTIYAQSLIASLQIKGIEEFDETKEILNEFTDLIKDSPDNEDIIKMYIEALLNIIAMLVQEQKAEEIVPLLDRMDDLAGNYPGNEEIQNANKSLQAFLARVGFKRSKEKEDKNRVGYL